MIVEKKKKKKKNFIVKGNEKLQGSILKKDMGLFEKFSSKENKVTDKKSLIQTNVLGQNQNQQVLTKKKFKQDEKLITFINSARIRKIQDKLGFPIKSPSRKRYRFVHDVDSETNVFHQSESVNLTARANVSSSMTFKQIERKFIGHLMQRGLRAKAVKIWLNFLIYLKRHFYNSPIKFTVRSIILTVVDIIRPVVVLKQRKIAGTVYQIPYFVQNVIKDNSTLIAIRWLIEAMNSRLEHDPAERLYKEFLDVLKKQGICYKKKQDIYAAAVKNRVYVRFLFSKSGKRRSI